MAKLRDQVTFCKGSPDQKDICEVFRHCREKSFIHVLTDGSHCVVPIKDYVKLLHPQDCRCRMLTRVEFVNRIRVVLDWALWLVKAGLFVYSMYAGVSLIALQITD